MARLYVPVANRVVTGHREKYVEQLKRLDNPFVMVYIDRKYDPEVQAKNLAELKENLAYFEAHGYDAGVWVQAFGFGNPLEGHEADIAAGYTRITDLSGRVAGDAMCPLDEKYMEFYLTLIRGIAEAGAKRIMLDDDLCLSVRPGLGCACDAHLKLLGQRLGRSVTRDELRKTMFTGEGNPLRSAWLKLMGDTLMEFCRKVRAEIDAVNPDVEGGFCAGYTSWDIEGVDALTLTKVLAGKNKPFMRLTGAPYWAENRRFPGQQMAQIIEFTRMQRSWCEGSGVDIFTENDSYPRPRYRVPAAIIETFDFGMSADSDVGQLKYLFDYYSRPGYEDGYLRAHEQNLPVMSRVRGEIGPMPAAGVWVPEEVRKVKDMRFPERESTAFEVMQSAFSGAASLMSSCGIATAYEKHMGVAAVFGDSGRTVQLDARAGWIIDYPAACELMARGVDVGLISAEGATTPGHEYFCAEDDEVLLDGGIRSGSDQGGPVFWKAELKAGAQVESIFRTGYGDMPASYRYENAQGQKFLVLLFDGGAVKANSGLSCSYYRQEQLISACEWMGAKLSAVVKRNPQLYLIVKETEEKTAVAFMNFSLDDTQDAVIELSRSCKEAEFIGCGGQLRGDRVILDPVGGWRFGAVILRK